MQSSPIISEQELETLKYPSGKLEWKTEYTAQIIKDFIEQIEILPAYLDETLKLVKETDLGCAYRPDGWNIRQIVHHMADSHMNGLIRTKLALTEENPTIKPYDENKFALLKDTFEADIAMSLPIIKGVHLRWVLLLKSIKFEDFSRTYYHPEMDRTFSIAQLLNIYSWHGKHHAEQIKVALKKRF